FTVNCVSPGVCGNGIVEPGESCDPPNGTTCTLQCQHQPECGDGLVEGAEQCDPPSAAAHCSTTCQKIPFCGDGIVQASLGATCPRPNGASCDATCHTPCVGPGGLCTDCERVSPLCPSSLNIVPGGTGCFGCFGFATGTNLETHCDALLSCIRASQCV